MNSHFYNRNNESYRIYHPSMPITFPLLLFTSLNFIVIHFSFIFCSIFQLVSLYDIKPPISKAKMTAITKAAMKSVKFYKHVVHGVEKFILKVSSGLISLFITSPVFLTLNNVLTVLFFGTVPA